MIKYMLVTLICDDCKKELVVKIWPGEPIDLERDLERNANEHGWVLWQDGLFDKCQVCAPVALPARKENS